MAPRAKLTAKQIDRARIAYEQEGKSTVEIAEELHVSPNTIRGALQREGVTMRARGPVPMLTPEQLEYARGAYEEEQTINEIAEQLHVGSSTVWQALKREGMTMRRRGGSASNLTLSYARATAVVQYLVSMGVNSSRLTAQGVGSSSPLTQQSDAAGLALNRRTEFVFYGLLAP